MARRAVIGLALAVTFSIGIGVGRLALPVVGDTGATAPNPSAVTGVGFGLIREAWDTLHKEYVGARDLKDQDLIYGAITGMTQAVGDTGHTSFLTPRERADRASDLSGSYVGIGVRIDVAADKLPLIVGVFRGSPAEKAGLVGGPEIIEVATFRAGGGDDGSGDRAMIDGRIVRDNVYGSIEEDAERRDFTVNALYYAIEDFSVRDFVGGFADVENRLLRLIGDPEARYREDPVRMLRAIRLATKLGFEIEAATAAQIPRLAGLLADASPARLFDESLKLLLGGHAEASVAALDRFGLLDTVLPATAMALRAPDQNHLRRLLDAALAQTDRRVREDRSVSPAFLFAALLWPAVVPRFQAALAAGHETQVAWGVACDGVLIEQVRRAALPRRISTPMLEIWQLQSRFEHLQRKRVVRLLEHPRFRAAYDFLALRADFEPEAATLFAFWRDVEGKPESVDGALRRVAEAHADDETAASDPRRRRRRGGRGRRREGAPTSDVPA